MSPLDQFLVVLFIPFSYFAPHSYTLSLLFKFVYIFVSIVITGLPPSLETFLSWENSISFYDLSITNVTIFLFFCFILFLFFLYFPVRTLFFVPNYWQLSVEFFYNFILNMLRQQITNIVSLRYFPYIFTLFFFIFFCNFLGLLPFGFTVTSHIWQTFSLAFASFCGVTLIGFYNNNLDFLKFFIPSNVPAFLLPFLILIELISYIIRPFSLAIRLFANMLAGHTLLFIIASFVIFVSSFVWFIFAFIPLVLVSLLEFCISFIQAYVFSVLLCVYLNDTYNAVH